MENQQTCIFRFPPSVFRFGEFLLDFRLFYIFTMSSAENFPILKKTWHLLADFIYNRFTLEKGLKLNFYV
jgi:hypothetical protein